MISKDKKYKDKSGYEVVIYAVYPDDKSNRAVHGAIKLSDTQYCARQWSVNGNYMDEPTESDLIEISPYEDFKIDDKVLVWDGFQSEKYKTKAHFAGIDEDGNPMTWNNGQTSFTSTYKTEWNFCIKYEENNEG